MPVQIPKYAIVNGKYVVGWTQDPLQHYEDYEEENPSYRQMFDYDLDPETEDFKNPEEIIGREVIQVSSWVQRKLVRMQKGSKGTSVGYDLTSWKTVCRT